MDRPISKRALPNTPRINDKILEYYQKFGQERDLEKFMRIYSPSGSSQDSQKTQRDSGNAAIEACCRRTRSRETMSSISSCEALAMMPSHPMSSGCCGVNSKSMPNIDVQGTVGTKDGAVDINIEVEKDNEKIFSTSSECIQTPKRNPHSGEAQAKTPESVAKSHRRLEWDSLGDIGYKKSMSTSNISVLERSLLKELFKENSITSEPSTSVRENENKTNPKQPEQHKNFKMTKSIVTEHATPPLACSTLVGEVLSANVLNKGARPKMISQSTSSTSLQKKFEKYAQTSLLKPANTRSQEVQVCISSSTSVIEGTATPSSFEYRSSRSSKSSKSSEYLPSDNSNKHVTAGQHPFITSITELLMKRKDISVPDQGQHQHLERLRALQSRLQTALDENKENQSHSQNTASSSATSFSLARHAPELDLGIQLICSLIDAKSINGKQKKKLIRDIVKRITRLNGEESESESTNKTSENSCHTHGTVYSGKYSMYDSVYSRIRNGSSASIRALSGNKIRTNVQSDLGLMPVNLVANSKNCISSSAINSTGDEIVNTQAYQEHKNGKQPTNTNTPPKQILSNKLSPNGGNKKKLTVHQQTIAANENRIQVPKLTDTSSPRKRSKGTSSELIYIQKKSLRAITSDTENQLLNTKQTRSTQTSKSSNSAESRKSHTSSSNRTTYSGATATSTSSSSSHNLPTQKSLRKPLNNSNVDCNNKTMLEWLNPLTQSEIEYEEKKRKESEKKAQEKTLECERHIQKSKHDSGRTKQLNWIENEIQRLECLKHLLLKDTHEKSSTSRSIDQSCSQLKDTENSMQTDKLYDTVYSDKSSVLSESAERLVNEIEIILEESDEDVVNLKDNSKSTKERRKETQIVYNKIPENYKSNDKTNKAKFHSIKETITFNKKQLLSDEKAKDIPPAPPGQRQKIATPTSDQSPENAKSLRDLVKEKKRDFMELYKTKKQNLYEALKQQQNEQSNFKHLPIREHKMFSNSENPVTTCAGHYSVPHTINRHFSPTEYAYPQSHLPPNSENRQTKISTDIIYSTAATSNQLKAKHHSPSTTTTAATTSSSTSMFCISSDVSVPMGSNNSTSTPTTTHHYDDVAAAVAGVAVQTSDSVLRSLPIYGPQLQPYFCSERFHTQMCSQPIISNTAAIQVKPKCIAYVIEFEDEKNSSEHSQVSPTNLKVKPTESSTTYTTNDVRAVVKASSEPQLMTLQDHLEKAKPKFCQQSKERKAILNQLQAMRQARDRQLREIIDNTSFNSLERRLQYLPPPPTQKVRILNTKDMKALTNKRFASLPEVVARQQREQEEKKRRSNRILRDVFNRRLQRRVRNGKLSLNHSKTVI